MASILIIDDNVAVQDIYQLALTRAGHDVYTSSDGVDALYQVSDHTPDLIILDLMMPLAAGDTVLGFIRSTDKLRNLRVLVVSAHPNVENLAQQLGADDFLAKPIDMKTFVDTVKRLLD